MDKITENYAIYQGDCIETMPNLPDNSIDFSVYSPPFANLYTYSGSDRDLGNCVDNDEFFEHYKYVVEEVYRVLKPGRLVAVHCMDLPYTTNKGIYDFSGDIIRLHEKIGFKYWDRKTIWKEPLMIAIRTRQQCLKHGQLVSDSTKTRGVIPDYILVFKKAGENEVPVTHDYGLTQYSGDIGLMNKLERQEYLGYTKKYEKHEEQRTNKLSQFIWRRYASALWEDIRQTAFLNYKPARDKEDERHVCPLQLDVIDRLITLYSNRGETVLTPFMGVGSEVYSAVSLDRKGIGIELKPSYFNQAAKNLSEIENKIDGDQYSMMDLK